MATDIFAPETPETRNSAERAKSQKGQKAQKGAERDFLGRFRPKKSVKGASAQLAVDPAGPGGFSLHSSVNKL